MEDNKTVFNYLGEIFTIYGVILAMIVILNLLVGDNAKGYSSFFEFGSGSLSTGTLIQLFFLSVFVSVARNLFMTDKWIKNMPIIGRSACLFISVMILSVVFVILFKWIPLNDIFAWIGFAVSFVVSTLAGVLISKLKEKAENMKMEKALERFKNGEEET